MPAKHVAERRASPRSFDTAVVLRHRGRRCAPSEGAPALHGRWPWRQPTLWRLNSAAQRGDRAS